MSDYDPPEAHEDYETLLELFRSLVGDGRGSQNLPSNDNNDVPMQIVRLLKQHPMLCTARYPFETNSRDRIQFLTPLMLLLSLFGCCFDLEQIKTIAELDPKQTHKSDNNATLDVALERTVDDAVIDFLVQCNPKGLLTYNKYGELPIHVFLGQSTSPDTDSTVTRVPRLETLKLLVEAEPECIRRPTKYGCSCLEQAVFAKCPIPILQYILDFCHHDRNLPAFEQLPFLKINKVERINRVYAPRPIHYTFDEYASRAVETIVSAAQVKRLHLNQKLQFTAEGFVGIMNCLERNSSVVNLSVLLQFCMLLAGERATIQNTIRDFLRNNRVVEHLELIEVEAADASLDLLEAIGDGLSDNQTIQNIKVKRFSVTSPDHLLHFLRRGAKSTHVLCFKFSRGNFDMNDHQFNSNSNSNLPLFDTIDWWKECSIRTLVLEDLSQMEPASYNYLLRVLANVPKLEALHIRQNPRFLVNESRIDVVEPLKHLLTHKETLHTLEISGIQITTEPFRTILMENQTLKSFNFDTTDGLPELKQNVLQALLEQNTTLAQVHWTRQERRDALFGGLKDVGEELGLLGQVSYWTRLNKWGRGRVRDATTTLPDFVDMLCDVLFAPDSKIIQLDKPNVIYGLLRESPSLWANADSCGRKRKYSCLSSTIVAS